MFTDAGKFIAEYADDEVYGEFRGEKHPLMQQYFLVEIEWANVCKLLAIEVEMLKKYKELVKNCNACKDGKKQSLFELEPIF
jgi:hypothetical protein